MHGDLGENQWALSAKVLDLIATHVQPGQHTLETGTGYSSVIFAAAGCNHTVISPVAAEHARLRNWGESHGVDFSNVTFIASKSEDALPSFESPPLSLALIDGWHAFPGPFIDWFFISQLLAVDGLLIVDDVQLRAPRILRDFLLAEKGRWRIEARADRSEMFRKLTGDVFVGEWDTQPFCATPHRSLGEKFKRYALRPFAKTVSQIPVVGPSLRGVREFVRKSLKNTSGR